MYVIVAGGGKVGFALSKALLANGHEVLCVERDPHRCAVIAEDLGSASYQGDGCEVSVLEDVGTGRADVFVALTGDDEDNLIACQVAKHRFHVPRTVARINNPENKEIFSILGVDATVNSTDVIMAQVAQEMPSRPLIPVMSLRGTGRELCHVEITADSRLLGRRLGELDLPGESTIVLVIGRDRTVHPAKPDIELAAGQAVLAVTRPEDEAGLREALTGVE